MYELLNLELVGIGDKRRFLGQREKCRFCGNSDVLAFGNKTNAHTYPEALGNKSLFSLDECVACNAIFSRYEDALCKAVGPFLTLGGTKGKNGVRQTGRSNSDFVLKHERPGERRCIRVEAKNQDDLPDLANLDGETLFLRFPVSRETFIPMYAYKAILKIALSLLPGDRLHLFRESVECLQVIDQSPGDYALQVGFSYASVGNAPPTLGCAVMQEKNSNSSTPYVIAIFHAGSVCFQIALHPDEKDRFSQPIEELGIKWITKLPKREGGFHSINYSEPIQFDWSELTPQQQPFEAFELEFNTQTNSGEFKPIESGK